MIGIFNETLIFGFEGRHDAVVGLIHRRLDVLWTLADGIDGLVDGQRQRMPMSEVPVFHAGHNIERAIDSEGHDGQLELIGQHEGTFLESAHVTRKRAGTLWEYDNGAIARLQNMACSLIGSLDLRGAALVDEYLVGVATGIAHERNLVELLLHHPLEVTPQKTVYEEDVEGSLMVGDEDIRLVRFQVFTTLDTNRQ